MTDIRKNYTFTGRVQGVGFRSTALYYAQRLGLTGWVKNEWDGTVVLEAQGPEEAHKELIRLLRNRNFSHVEYVAEIPMPLQKESGFHVR